MIKMKKLLFVAMVLLSFSSAAQVLPGRNSSIKQINNNTVINNATTTIVPQPKPYVAVNEIKGSGTSTMAIRKVNSNYELTGDDYAVVALSGYQGGPTTIMVTLPAATIGEGRIYIVKNAGAGFVQVITQQLNEWGENTVRQTGTPVIRGADVNHNSSASFQSDGKLWWRF
jgi:hypothetical protein